MKIYLFAAILSLSLIACGGGGDGENDSASEKNINVILNRPPVTELAKVSDLNGHLLVTDYRLNKSIALLEAAQLKVTISDTDDLALLAGQETIATGTVNAANNTYNYDVSLRFSSNLSNNLFGDKAAKQLINEEYSGFGTYDRETHIFTINIRKMN